MRKSEMEYVHVYLVKHPLVDDVCIQSASAEGGAIHGSLLARNEVV